MTYGRLARTATGAAGAILMVATLALTPAPALAADQGPEAREAVPLLQAVERLWAELARPVELLFGTVTADSDSDPAEATTTSDDDDLESSVLNGPRIDPDG